MRRRRRGEGEEGAEGASDGGGSLRAVASAAPVDGGVFQDVAGGGGAKENDMGFEVKRGCTLFWSSFFFVFSPGVFCSYWARYEAYRNMYSV